MALAFLRAMLAQPIMPTRTVYGDASIVRAAREVSRAAIAELRELACSCTMQKAVCGSRAGKTRRQARGNTRTLSRTRTASLPCNIGRKKLASRVVHLNLGSLHARNQRATAKNGQQASQFKMQ